MHVRGAPKPTGVAVLPIYSEIASQFTSAAPCISFSLTGSRQGYGPGGSHLERRALENFIEREGEPVNFPLIEVGKAAVRRRGVSKLHGG